MRQDRRWAELFTKASNDFRTLMNTREQYKLSHLLYCILKARSERLEPPATGVWRLLKRREKKTYNIQMTRRSMADVLC